MEGDDDEHQTLTLRRSNSNLSPMVSATIGRVMSALLSSRPKKLNDSIARLPSPPPLHISSLASLDDALWCLHKYVKESAEKKEPLEQILVPLIEHSLKYKDSKNAAQSLIILNWLFQDELIFQALSKSLANLIIAKEDRFVSLGWCVLVRQLLEYETTLKPYLSNGIREKYNVFLKILCSSISHLLYIIRTGSTLQDNFELPTRLSISAADCVLALTGALVKIPSTEASSNSSSVHSMNSTKRPTPVSIRGKRIVTTGSSEARTTMEMQLLLWDQIDELIIVMQRLIAWSRKSRPLHAEGLKQVLRWLQKIKEHYGSTPDEIGLESLKTGALLLSSCWKHYGMLAHLEDRKFSLHCKEYLEQYLSGIQFYTDKDNHTEESMVNKDSGIETRKFFLNCLCLLLGRLDNNLFEITMSEFGSQISRVLLSQLHCANEDVVDGAVSIFKAVIFKRNHSSDCCTPDGQIDAVLPLLLELLDERDGTAKAAVVLIAEYCSISNDSQCLEEILKRLASENVSQRSNAVNVVSELICRSSDSVNLFSQSVWQNIVNHLLQLLEDEAPISKKILELLPKIEPALVLPTLVHLVYSSNDKLQSAPTALVDVLKHNQKPEVICLLLDCLSNICQPLNGSEASRNALEAGSTVDADRIFGLIPEWSKTVLKWDDLIGSLVDKMFLEPSNAIIVKFLSLLSEHLAEEADLVLHRILSHMKGLKDIDDSENTRSLFDRLSPLLLMRMLPLQVFSHLNSSLMYGGVLNRECHEGGDVNAVDDECIAQLLLIRAFNRFEYEDVRKLAAELCGRLHPQVLYPFILSHLEEAVGSEDIVKIKACLFSLCTSLVVRGRASISHPVMLNIRAKLETLLSWPSLDGDEVSKVQHGCIDCLALMICAELQASEVYKDSHVVHLSAKGSIHGEAATKDSVVMFVMHNLTEIENKTMLPSKMLSGKMPIPVRLCMANVLISACQKISDTGKKSFARAVLPSLIHFIEMTMEADIRAACVQVLFSAVYHLKLAVLPYAADLFKLSLKSLEKGSEKEKMAGVKLMAALLGSDDAIVERISGELLEARSVLSCITSTTASSDVRQLCNQLLLLFSSS